MAGVMTDHDSLNRIREALASGDEASLHQAIAEARPADLAELLERLEAAERETLFGQLDDARAAAVLHELDETLGAELLRRLPPARASRILGDMPDDDAADVLQDLPDEAADALLAGMDADDARAVRELMEYDENTAGGRMVTDFVTVPRSALVSQVIEQLRAHPAVPETAYYIYVRDEFGRLAGVVSLRDLVVADPAAAIETIMTREVISIRADADQEEAAELVARYDLLALPVVEADERLVGVITVDDIFEVMEEEATEDIVGFAGHDEAAPERVAPSWRARLPRLVGIFVAGGVAAALLSLLRGLEGRAFVLFIPLALAVSEVVTGQVLAGVAATARRETPRFDVERAAGRELLVSGAMAAAMGVLLALFLGQGRGLERIGVVLGAAVLAIALVAALVGITVPVIARALRRDPSALPVSLVTALADVASLAAYGWVVQALR